MLTVVTPATSRALTTVEEAWRYLGLDDSAADDVEVLVRRASAAIASHCHRVFGIETVRESFAGLPGDSLLLSRYPVRVIDSAAVAGRSLALADFECDMASGIVYRLRGGAPASWGCGRVQVTYRAGWSLPGAPDRDLPSDIEQACLLFVSALFYGQGRDPLLRSWATEGVGSASFVANSAMEALPPQAIALLEPYRAARFG